MVATELGPCTENCWGITEHMDLRPELKWGRGGRLEPPEEPGDGMKLGDAADLGLWVLLYSLLLLLESTLNSLSPIFLVQNMDINHYSWHKFA